MLKTITFGLFSLLTGTLAAQSLTPTVIASTGGFSQNANGSLSYTVGEMTMVETFSSGNNILTQGFQQPNDNVTGLLDVIKDEYGSLVLYPNPAVDNVWFGLQLPEEGHVVVAVHNELGQKVGEVFNSAYTGGKVVEQVNVSTYAAGVYFLTMTFTTQKESKVYITTKKFQVVI